MRFAGKVALVTGAARGIGAAVACAMAAEGANVVVNDIGDGQPIVEEIERKGGKALFAACDVADESQVEAMFDRTVKEFGRIDIVVPNAAYASPSCGSI